LPSIRALNARWSYYDFARNCFVYEAREGNLDVEPGDGRWLLMLGWEPGKYCGKASACAASWVAKRFADQDWNSWSDLNASPIVKAKYPNGGDNDAGGTTSNPGNDAVTVFSQQVAQARVTKVIGLPQGQGPADSFDVDVVKLADAVWQSFPARLEYNDRKIAEAWLGSHLAFEVTDRGSYAAAETHKGVTRELVQGDAQALADVVNAQLVHPFVVANFGIGVAAVCCPTVRWPIDIEEDSAGITKSFLQIMQALKSASDAGYDVNNLGVFGKRFGLDITKGARPVQVQVADAKADAAPKPTAEKDDKAEEPIKRSIRKVGPSQWRAYSPAGENLGTFGSLQAAKDREADKAAEGSAQAGTR
jgi:hypothetical protein